MNVLGSISQLYMLVLLVLMFAGTGFALWRFINYSIERIQIGLKKSKSTKYHNNNMDAKNKQNGGYIMNKNGWLYLAVFSFVGVLVSVILLGFMSNNNVRATGGQAQNGYQAASGQVQNEHQAQAQGGMNINTPMGSMQMQGNMAGTMAQNDMYQQQMNQIQQQLAQLQQQLANGTGNMQMPQYGMNNMGGNMQMPQNGMNNMGGNMQMPQNGMNNMGGNMQMPQNGMSNMMGMMDNMMGMMDDMMGMMNNMNSMPQNNSAAMPMM